MSNWRYAEKMQSKSYICSYCGQDICSEEGYRDSMETQKIYICHKCKKPTYFDSQIDANQYPGPKYGKSFVLPIPKDINLLYEEARSAYSVNAYTAVGMCCRKLLMNICVNLGAEEGLKFVQYVDYLDKENYIPRGSKKWVDVIRKKGNEATHQINFLSKKDAQQMLDFCAIIITVIYENDLAIKEA